MTTQLTEDITRDNSYAFKLAQFLGDRRTKRYRDGASRKEIMAALGDRPDPAVYAKLYTCFVTLKRGVYAYRGENLYLLK